MPVVVTGVCFCTRAGGRRTTPDIGVFGAARVAAFFVLVCLHSDAFERFGLEGRTYRPLARVPFDQMDEDVRYNV